MATTMAGEGTPGEGCVQRDKKAHLDGEVGTGERKVRREGGWVQTQRAGMPQYGV